MAPSAQGAALQAQLQRNIFNVWDTCTGELTSQKIYSAYFNSLPNVNTIKNVNGDKVIDWINHNVNDKIIFKHYSIQYNENGTKRVMPSIYIIEGEILVSVSASAAEVFYSTNMEMADELASKFREFTKEPDRATFYMLVKKPYGDLELAGLKIKKPRLTLNANYNDDLSDLHPTILKKMRKKNASGLTLFYGIPGTGKSTYLRYLISQVRKRVIFLSPRLAGNVDAPEFANWLVDQSNTIIIIEDAEDLLVSRQTENNSAISTLLNLTDGLLGSSLGIQFICTFNTDIGNIDKALLRKGRLNMLYEFKALSIEKSRSLLNIVKTNKVEITEPMTLAEIYHMVEPDFKYERGMHPIGFSTLAA